jgi:hypothetical protein
MFAVWGPAVVAYLVCLATHEHLLIRQRVIHSRPSQPIFPITAACMIAVSSASSTSVAR